MSRVASDRARRDRVRTLAAAFVVVCSCAGGASACSGPHDAPAETAVIVRDSAGIGIVENPEYAPDSTTWSIDTVPSLTIGHDESKGERYQFAHIVGATELSDGRIVIADAQLQEIRVFDPSGTYLRAIGRIGSGPGEFTGVGGLLRLSGDTIAVRGPYGGEPMPVFDGFGGFAGSWSPPQYHSPASSEGPYMTPSIAAVFADGTVLARAWQATALSRLADRPRTPTLVERSARLLRADRGGGVVTDYGEHPADRFVYYRENGGHGRPGFIESGSRYLPQPRIAAFGTTLYMADGDAFEIRALDADGRLRRIVRKRHPPAVIPRAWADSMWSAVVEGMARSEIGEFVRQVPPPPVPEFAPALDRLVTDADGNLWVRNDPPGRPAPPQWFVFDSAGVLRHSLRTRIDPLEIGSDYVLAVVRDEDNVPALNVFPLRKQ